MKLKLIFISLIILCILIVGCKMASTFDTTSFERVEIYYSDGTMVEYVGVSVKLYSRDATLIMFTSGDKLTIIPLFNVKKIINYK